GAHDVGEAQLVEAVVDGAGDAFDLQQAVGHDRHEADGQEAVGDGAAHLAPGAFDVDVDPLAVAGDAGEVVDHLLGDLDPVGRAELAAHDGLQVLELHRVHSAPSRVWAWALAALVISLRPWAPPLSGTISSRRSEISSQRA